MSRRRHGFPRRAGYRRHGFPPLPAGAATLSAATLAPVTTTGSGDGLRVSRRLVIPEADLSWRFSGSGGPGGQHANTANTRVELVFDVAGSEALGPRQRARLLDRLGPRVRVVVSEERSQARNRQIALERLAERLEEALRVERPRLATAPTKASQERRLRAKRRRSERKVERRTPAPDQDR